MLQAELEFLLASYSGDTKVVKELLAKGVNPNTEFSEVAYISLCCTLADIRPRLYQCSSRALQHGQMTQIIKYMMGVYMLLRRSRFVCRQNIILMEPNLDGGLERGTLLCTWQLMKVKSRLCKFYFFREQMPQRYLPR